jgi:hypothetical protein
MSITTMCASWHLDPLLQFQEKRSGQPLGDAWEVELMLRPLNIQQMRQKLPRSTKNHYHTKLNALAKSGGLPMLLNRGREFYPMRT